MAEFKSRTHLPLRLHQPTLDADAARQTEACRRAVEEEITRAYRSLNLKGDEQELSRAVVRTPQLDEHGEALRRAVEHELTRIGQGDGLPVCLRLHPTPAQTPYAQALETLRREAEIELNLMKRQIRQLQ